MQENQENKRTDLSQYSNKWYKPGNIFARIIWYVIGELLFNSFIPGSWWRKYFLKLFGAKVGRGVVIKPYTKIKYPWKLKIDNYVWMGEGVWIDNLADITIGNNTCISQGAMLLCGNHNYKKTTFDLIVRSIIIEEGAWIGAQCVICPGVIVKSHTVIMAGSILTASTDPYSIYQGNPAVKIKVREIN